jgi:hypothetical protein
VNRQFFTRFARVNSADSVNAVTCGNRRMLVSYEPHQMKRLDLTFALVNDMTTHRGFDVLSM